MNSATVTLREEGWRADRNPSMTGRVSQELPVPLRDRREKHTDRLCRRLSDPSTYAPFQHRTGAVEDHSRLPAERLVRTLGKRCIHSTG
jgi:hypothetical protein